MSSDVVFVNRFWGQQDGGFRIIQSRLHHSIATLTELLQFYKEKLTIEKDYNKKMSKLINSITLGSRETGSIKVAMERLQIESNNMFEQNQKLVKSVTLHNFEKLQAFYQSYHKNVTKIETHIGKILTRKRDYSVHLEAAKEKYHNDCKMIKSLQLTCQTTWGKELEKNTHKLQKLQQHVHIARDNYAKAVEKCNEIHEIWVRDWRTALLNIYQLEIERIQICKLNCFSYCNHIATLCVDWDHLVDVARTTFAKIVAPKDVHDFAEAHGTSDKIPNPPKFIDFMNGFDEDSENVQYDVATFQDPDYADILTRTFSTQSSPTHIKDPVTPSPQKKPPKMDFLSPSKEKTLPPIVQHLDPSQSLVSGGLKKQPSRNSAYYSGQEDGIDDDDDVFDSNKNSRSPTGLEYSNPTNYTSNTVRSWASPKKKERLEMQERINRRLRDLTYDFPRTEPNQVPKPSIPIAKDFSMDFIAKALEDLNSGGDGDMSLFRRSVRSQRQQQPNQKEHPKEDDVHEIARRLDSISFQNPSSQRPKSMVDEVLQRNDLSTTVLQNPENKRFSLQSPTKSFVDLHSIVDDSQEPRNYVTKAKALYSYKSREEGELSFRKGWNMYIIHKQEDNWFVCELAANCGADRGNVGLVPYNYIREGEDLF